MTKKLTAEKATWLISQYKKMMYPSQEDSYTLEALELALLVLTAAPVARLKIHDGESGPFISGEVLDPTLAEESKVDVYRLVKP